MPTSGSQITICDLPIRFDTYAGCSHACAYCFVSRKTNIAKIGKGESEAALQKFIKGERRAETRWCDWDIPLHWGGLSDPFQPIERKAGLSLAALRVFAESGYPFAVSTKSTLPTEEPYFDLLRHCNCVMQISAVSPKFDKIEQGAPSYHNRLQMAEKIAKYCRVNIRIQPYIPGLFFDIIKAIPKFASAGVHGITIEGMKYTTKRVDGLVENGGDYVYPRDILLQQFQAIKSACHKSGIRFYCAENRLRALSDDLCCCGVDGLGWKVATANLNHILFDDKPIVFTDAMKKVGSAAVFNHIRQDTITTKTIPKRTFEQQLMIEACSTYAYTENGTIYMGERKRR